MLSLPVPSVSGWLSPDRFSPLASSECAMSFRCVRYEPAACGSMFWFSRNTFVGS